MEPEVVVRLIHLNAHQPVLNPTKIAHPFAG